MGRSLLGRLLARELGDYHERPPGIRKLTEPFIVGFARFIVRVASSNCTRFDEEPSLRSEVTSLSCC